MKKYARLLGAVLLAFLSVLSYAQAPVPFINLPLVPDATAPGGGDFTLTVNGTGFVSNSVVNWNGTPLATQFVSGSQVTATVPAADVATASTAWVTVVNSGPGGGTSSVAFFSVTTNEGNGVTFTTESCPGTGSAPKSVAAGDFNRDGNLDLAVANSGDNTVSILLGDGAGNFTYAFSLHVGSSPWTVVAGDFNGDGIPDLAVSNNLGDTLSILLGDGTGNFSLRSTPPVGHLPMTVATGDFNGDGKLDLAVANYGSSTVSILLGDGTGSFTLASSPRTGSGPDSVVVSDFNGDGKLDLAVSNEWSYSASILLGDGTGNFTLSSSPAVEADPYSLEVGDFNGDGKPDLAVVNYCGINGGCFYGTLSILLGDGAGNFTLASSPVVGDRPTSATVGDFNGDGKLDLAVWGESQDVAILLGDGSGNFSVDYFPPYGSTPKSMAVGDFDGDGRLDLAVPNYWSNNVCIMLQPPKLAGVTLSPTSLNFGTQLFGTTSNPQPVTLTNIGSAPLNITGITTNSASFLRGSNCGSSLAAGKGCTIRVALKPHRTGTITGNLAITDDAPNSPQMVSLTGVGTAVTLLPSSLSFGDQAVGTTSQSQTVTLTNYGPRALSIAGVGFIGKNPKMFGQTNTCGTSVPAGGSCTISVTFLPTKQGARSATLGVGDNGGGSPQTVSLSGNGT